jgi:hypothetical protein
MLSPACETARWTVLYLSGTPSIEQQFFLSKIGSTESFGKVVSLDLENSIWELSQLVLALERYAQ